MVHFTLNRSVALVGVALASLQPALAQDAASKAPGKVNQVNVVGERQVNRIDRQVYDVKNDVNASNGSAAG